MNDDNALSRGAGGFNCCAEEKWTAVFRHNYFIIWNPANTRAVAQWDYRLAQTTIIITIRIGIAGPETWPWENVNVKTAIKVWRRRKSKWQEFGSKYCVSLGGGILVCLTADWLRLFWHGWLLWWIRDVWERQVCQVSQVKLVGPHSSARTHNAISCMGKTLFSRSIQRGKYV